MSEKTFGAESSEVILAYRQIARAYLENGESDKSMCFDKKVEGIVHKKVPEIEAPETAQNYTDIASAYYDLGKYDKALQLY